MRARLAALAALALGSACVTAQVSVPTEQASRLQRRLSGEERFLRVSMYVTPFFGDSTRKLLTSVPPDEVRWLDHPDGSPVNPGPVEQVLPAGTRVRIVSLEFPSPSAMVERVLFTPRTLLWVRLEVAGARNAQPQVLVLRPGLRTEAEVEVELERYVSRDDPARRLEGFSEPVREAIRLKNATVEMPAEALEMAWGYPEQKRLELVGTQRKELWSWPGARRASLLDGKVTELVP
jgi:hypothetical protein